MGECFYTVFLCFILCNYRKYFLDKFLGIHLFEHMPRFHRIHDLLAILHGRRYAISLRELTEELECSKATVKRHINALRFEYSAPIRYDKKYGGYVLDKSDEDSLQLPGIWFNISELHSLLLIQELLDQLEPGLLKVDLNPFRQRIESILSNRNIQSSDLRKRIQFIGVGVRICCPLQFKMVVRATMERKRISINYHSRTTNRLSKRTVSPQRLLYYRGNWYLVAYCHTRKEIRTLALDRIKETHPLKEPCSELEESELKRHFGQSYGIFSGEAEETAILRFTKERARWVA